MEFADEKQNCLQSDKEVGCFLRDGQFNQPICFLQFIICFSSLSFDSYHQHDSMTTGIMLYIKYRYNFFIGCFHIIRCIVNITHWAFKKLHVYCITGQCVEFNKSLWQWLYAFFIFPYISLYNCVTRSLSLIPSSLPNQSSFLLDYRHPLYLSQLEPCYHFGEHKPVITRDEWLHQGEGLRVR